MIERLSSGTFIRVRADHPNPYRAGLDAMVTHDSPEGKEMVGLMFGYDRHNHRQNVQCVGTEAWDKSELDMTTTY